MPIVSYPGVPLSDTAEEFFQRVTDVVPPAVVHTLIREPNRDPVNSPVADKTSTSSRPDRSRTVEGQPRRAKMPIV